MKRLSACISKACLTRQVFFNSPAVVTRLRFFLRLSICCLLLVFGVDQGLGQSVSSSARNAFERARISELPSEKIRYLRRALAESPQFVEARVELAKVLMRQQQFAQALVQLDSCLNFDRQNANVWFQKGRAHAEIGQDQIALRSLERAIEILSDVPEFYVQLGELHFKLKQYDEALHAFERVLSFAIASDNKARQADAWYWKGRVHAANRDTTEALSSFQKALQLDKTHAQAQARLSEIEKQARLDSLYRQAASQEKAEDWQRARSSYLAILKEDSTFKDVAQKLALLEAQLEDLTEPEKPPAKSGPSKKQDASELKEQSPAKQPEAEAAKTATKPQPDAAADSTTSAIAGIEPDTTEFDSAELAKETPRAAPQEGDPASPQVGPIVWIVGIGVVVLIVAFVLLKNRWPRPAPGSRGEPTRTVILPKDIFKTEFERYRIEKEIGRGGMGHVYKAYDLKLERPVALKVIRLERSMQKDEIDERIARFRREAKATAILNHPNIVSLYDYDEKDGTFYMTMEYVEGVSIEDRLDKEKSLDVNEAVRVVKACCQALDYAHRRNLVHRDIKPSNIMIDKEGRVKVLDFGVAKMLNLTETQSYTMTGVRIGSPSYMSPEQINTGMLDGRSDIFALGVVFYEMLTGQKPFEVNEGETLGRLFYVILNTEAKKPSSLRKEIPKQLDRIALKMLAKDPEKRFQTSGEIVASLP